MRTPRLSFLVRHCRDGVNRTRIKELLKARGLTCAQTARACGKSYMAIKNKLAGYDAFTVEDIQRFYKLLNLNGKEASEIFFGRSA